MATKTKARATTTRKATTTSRQAKPVVVRVAKLPGTSKEIVLDPKHATLGEALRGYGISMREATDVRVNNKPTKDPETKLPQGAIVTVVGQVNGG